MMYFIKGCRGSGTNFLKNLLEANFKLTYQEVFWKHGIFDDEEVYYNNHDILIFHIYKPLKANLLSLFRYKWHMPHLKGKSFKYFIDNNIHSTTISNKVLQRLYNHKRTIDVYDNPTIMIETKNEYFNNISDASVSYTELLIDPITVLTKIHKELNLIRKTDYWITHVDTVFDFNFEEKFNYFKNQLWDIEYDKGMKQ